MSNLYGGPGVSLNYRGNNALQPPNWNFVNRDPDQYDTRNYSIGDLWLNTETEEAFVLVSLAGDSTSHGMRATWVTWTSGGGSVVEVVTDSGTAVPSSGTLNILGGSNIGTTATGNTVTVNLDSTISVSGITVTAGNILVTNPGTISVTGSGTISTINGDILTAAGDLYAATGDIIAGAGNITAAVGTISATTGPIVAGTTITATTGITSSSGNISAPLGQVNAGTTMTAGTGITATTGNVVVTAGNLVMPSSYNAGATSGVIRFGANRVLTTNGTTNLFLGVNTANTTLSGTNNVVLGSSSFTAATTSQGNVLVGNSIMTTAAAGADGNCVIGNSAFTIGTGGNNCIMGISAAAVATTASGGNTIIGNNAAYDSGAGLGLVSGTQNTLVGYTAGSAYRSNESGNIILGDNDGVVGESGVTRIGNDTGTVTAKCFIRGIRGVTTDINDAVAVLIDSAGQLGTTSSTRSLKDNIVDMGSESESILNLRPVKFNWTSDLNKKAQYGLIAEEVAEVFPWLCIKDKMGNPTTVKYHELPVLLLNEIIKLSRKVDILEKKLSE